MVDKFGTEFSNFADSMSKSFNIPGSENNGDIIKKLQECPSGAFHDEPLHDTDPQLWFSCGYGSEGQIRANPNKSAQ